MKLGIIGGGQLAMMLAEAAQALNIETLCIDSNPQASATWNSHCLIGSLDDHHLLDQFAQQVDVITYENENIDPQLLHKLQQCKPIYPSIIAIQTAQDRLLEKQLFEKLAIPTTHYFAIDDFSGLEAAAKQLEYQAVIKTRRLGYDGKGQARIHHASDCEPAWQTLATQGALLLENLIDFDYEVSQIAARDQQGNIVFYPLTLNHHRAGILRTSIAPFIETKLMAQSQQYMRQILEALNYVGVLTIEFFVQNQQLIANEMAPRVHNSGHWTIEGAYTSQFSNHVRSVCHLALGESSARSPTAMINIIGQEPKLSRLLKHHQIFYHSYHKQARPNRKLAHLTVVANDEKTLQEKINSLQGEL